jgi:hypothetical protein
MYEAKILKHSISDAGVELITFEVNYPHAVHKDIMTHRWARNFQSFRALPPEILLAKLKAGEFFIPEVFGYRVKGMGQRNEHIEGTGEIDQFVARNIWDQHVIDTIDRAEKFLSMDIAKQQINFLLQDLCYIRGIITTTLPKLDNFFGLRTALDDEGNPFARPEVYKIATMMLEVFEASEPQKVGQGAWHLPLVSDEEIHEGYPDWDPDDQDNWIRHWDYWKKISVGRCARVSYLTHDGIRDPEADIRLHDQLLKDGHMSPFEHQGQPILEPWFDALHVGSYENGWRQYRKLIPGEHNYNVLRMTTKWS